MIRKNKKLVMKMQNYIYMVTLYFILLYFFIPDPTVKRQSGFLTPSVTNSTLLGSGINTPYYFALAENKDATLNPKIYADENPVIQTEYRHLTKNSYSILDASFNQGYKKTSDKKTAGSRNHIFARSDIDLDLETFDESKLSQLIFKKRQMILILKYMTFILN